MAVNPAVALETVVTEFIPDPSVSVIRFSSSVFKGPKLE